MIRLVLVLITVSVLAAASNASAACGWFGTQLDCDLGSSRVVIGTQAAEEPTYLRSFWPQPFHGTNGLRPDRAAPGLPFELELQDVPADVSLCRDIRNYTYCD